MFGSCKKKKKTVFIFSPNTNVISVSYSSLVLFRAATNDCFNCHFGADGGIFK